MSAIRVPGPDGLIRLIDQGPAVGRITHSLKAARGSSVAATIVYGALVVGRSGDANAAAHAESKKRARDAARQRNAARGDRSAEYAARKAKQATS